MAWSDAPPTPQELAQTATPGWAKEAPTDEELGRPNELAAAKEFQNFGSRISSGITKPLSDFGNFFDKYTGAPVRAGLGAAQKGEDPLLAAGHQFGRETSEAPTAQQLAQKAGVPDSPLFKTYETGGESTLLPKTDLEKGLDQANESVPSKSAVAGFGLDTATNPLSYLPGEKLAGAIGKAGELAAPITSKIAPIAEKMSSMAPEVASYLKNKFNSGVAKTASLVSGVDSDAALRQIERPGQTRLAQTEGFGNELGQNAMNNIAQQGSELGQNVAQAKDQLVANQRFNQAYAGKRGIEAPTGIDQITNDNQSFLERNQPSDKGFSALTDKERQSLESYGDSLNGANAEDLLKLREEIDGRVSHLYGKEGAASPYERQLMKIRGMADSALDTFDPSLNSANTDFSDYLNNKKVLGLNNESTAESVTNNLYSGANKTAKQQAAAQLLPSDMLEQFKDVAANKSFSGQGPAGSGWGVRRILGAAAAIPTKGLSLVATEPKVWQMGLRGLGNTEQAISSVLQNAPQTLGKYAAPLQAAAARGPQALAVSHYVLQQQDQGYREKLDQLTSPNELTQSDKPSQ